MSSPELTPNPLPPASTKLSQRLKLSWELTKKHGPTFFVIQIVGWAIIGLIGLLLSTPFGLLSILSGAASQSLGVAFSAIAFLVLIVPILMLIAGFYMIGLNTLLLLYVDGQRPSRLIATLLSPWSRFGTIFMSLLLWIVVICIVELALLLIGAIPILGTLISFAASSLLGLITGCALLYIADAKKPKATESVTLPFRMVLDNFGVWLGNTVPLMVMMLVLGVVAVLALTTGTELMASGSVPAVLFGLFCWLALFVLFVAFMVFTTFLFAVTYRQTRSLSENTNLSTL